MEKRTLPKLIKPWKETFSHVKSPHAVPNCINHLEFFFSIEMSHEYLSTFTKKFKWFLI